MKSYNVICRSLNTTPRKVTSIVTDLLHSTFAMRSEISYKVTKVTSKLFTEKKIRIFTKKPKEKTPHMYLCNKCNNSIKIYLYILILVCNKSCNKSVTDVTNHSHNIMTYNQRRK